MGALNSKGIYVYDDADQASPAPALFNKQATALTARAVTIGQYAAAQVAAAWLAAANLWTDLPLDTILETDGDAAAYTLSAGALIIPTTGIYHVDLLGTGWGPINGAFRITLAGARIAQSYLSNGYSADCTISATRKMTAGQALKVGYFTVGAATVPAGSTLMIHRVK